MTRYYHDDEEPEVEVLSLDDLEEGPDLDPFANPDWTGLDEDFDGTALIDNLLSGDTE